MIAETRDGAGNQGSVFNRINQSIDEYGNLRKDAVDQTLHGVGFHTDDVFGTEDEQKAWVDPREELHDLGDAFVRVLKSEVDKLTNIASGATNLYINVDDVLFPASLDQAATINFVSSSTVTWQVDAPNNVKANLAFPITAAHRHYYDQTPVPSNITVPDYMNYAANSADVPYIEGSLRVYINGVRLSKTGEVYVPGSLITESWTLMSYTENEDFITFTLTAAIAADDIIRIDYDIQLSSGS